MDDNANSMNVALQYFFKKASTAKPNLTAKINAIMNDKGEDITPIPRSLILPIKSRRNRSMLLGLGFLAMSAM